MKLEQVLKLLKKQDVTHTGMITSEQELQEKIEEMGEEEFKRRYITKIGITLEDSSDDPNPDTGGDDPNPDTDPDPDVTYTFGVPVVTLEYQEAPAEGGSLTPSYSYSQTWEGSDGTSGTIVDEGGDLTFSSSTLDADVSTGVLTVPANELHEYVTLGDVTLEVYLNGQTGSTTTTIYQVAAEVVPTQVSTLDELKAALEAGDENIQINADIVSDESLSITKDCTINLNSYTFTRDDASGACAMFIVSGGTVNFEGEGSVQSNGTSSSDWVQALWVNDESAVVNISGNISWKGGIWDNLDDTTTGSSACIYCQYGLINIYGGSFETGYAVDMKQYSVLNCLDASYKAGTANIVVYGGDYYNFDPANNTSEGDGTNFVANGYVTELDDNNWYHVVAVDAAPTSTYSATQTTTKKTRKKKS